MPSPNEVLERMCGDIDSLHRLASGLKLETAAMLLAMARLELQLVRHEITDEEFAAFREARYDPPAPN